VSVEIGMWLERFLIVVPSLSVPRLPMTATPYAPSWVEWSLFAAFVALFVFLYAVFTKLFPIVSIWEIRKAESTPCPCNAEEELPRHGFCAHGARDFGSRIDRTEGISP
jgi:hypothetical protein